jgi:hypothetical protein
MSQTIQDFYRVAQTRGFSRDFMMRVTSIGEDTFNENDFVYITTKQLPNRQITNQAVPYMGLNFNTPGTVTYPGSESWSVTFRNDLRGIIRSKLENWQINGVFDDATSTGDLYTRGTDKVIQLEQLDDKQNVVNVYRLFGVYIVGLGAIEGYDATGAGAPTTFSATLAYHYWRHVNFVTQSSLQIGVQIQL